MKKYAWLLPALLLLTGCRSESAPETAQADIAEQTSPSSESESSEEPAGNWALDLMESVFGYDSIDSRKQSSFKEELPEQRETEPPPDPASFYTLTVDDTGLVTRTKGPCDEDSNLTWVIEVNGVIQLERNAEMEYSYRPMNYGAGTYRIWLKAWAQGYHEVSNVIEYEGPLMCALPRAQEIDGFESWRVGDTKQHMKHLVQVLRERYGQPEYKMGFVIDPDHDGICNGVVFCAGTGDYGENVQYIYENMSADIRFGTTDYLVQDTIKCTLGIWCDAETGMDYIVRIEEDGTAYDCVTEQVIPDFRQDAGFFTFTGEDVSDRDTFIVSYQGVPEQETA